jgi:predicted AAA+ superfamily ATPase
LNDTGLLAYLLGVTDGRLQEEPRLLGPVLENFVALELCKQVSWSERQPTLYHYRTQAGSEVDFLLEDADGRIAAVEVKAAAAVTARDVQSMRELAVDLGNRFVRGVVIYAGTTAVPFGPRIHALPIDSLWAGE